MLPNAKVVLGPSKTVRLTGMPRETDCRDLLNLHQSNFFVMENTI